MIGRIPEDNLYGRQAVTHVSCYPHSTIQIQSIETAILHLFGATVAAGYLPERLCF